MSKNKFNPQSHIGEIHGIYTIIDVLNKKDKYGHYIYIAECKECGYKKYSHYGAISGKSHEVNACNHLMLGNKYIQQTKWTNKRIQNIFKGLKERCYNESHKDYKWYGAKGVKVCEEWLNNPISFEKWSLQNGYKNDLTIDRIDENKNYSPDNCRWISNVHNAKYKSTTHLIDVNGEKHTGRDWSKKLGIGINTINKYIKKYGEENTIQFIKKFMNEERKILKNKQSYYDLYMK